ncbi:AraC family transcriptional regulator [Kutzneria sp. CA-103260]|nr:AraC family transcriptional regulator [Kutzneria sp. CA-103260]
MYREFVPARAVAAAVACTWHGSAGWSRNLRILPDGCADLVWEDTELTLVTTGGEPVRWLLPAAGRSTGLRLRCGGAGSVLGVPMSELPTGRIPLTTLWGDTARRAEEMLASSTSQRRVLEMLIAERLAAGFEPERSAYAAVRGLGVTAASVENVADDLGISERGLRRRVRDEVGCGPKQLHRVLRFNRFVRRIPALAAGRTSLAAVAADLGYADQSHLGRECRRLGGSSPAAMIRSWSRQDGVSERFQTRRP